MAEFTFNTAVPNMSPWLGQTHTPPRVCGASHHTVRSRPLGAARDRSVTAPLHVVNKEMLALPPFLRHKRACASAAARSGTAEPLADLPVDQLGGLERTLGTAINCWR